MGNQIVTTFDLRSAQGGKWQYQSSAVLTRRSRDRSESEGEIEWIPTIYQATRGLERLRQGWDGDDAPVPTAPTVEIALDELMRCVRPGVPAPDVHPTVRGGVQFEWHQAGWDIEMECLPSGRVIAWGEERQSREGWEGDLPAVREHLILALQRLAACPKV